MGDLDEENANALKWLAGPEGLAGLPLALRQAGSYVRERRFSWTSYKKAYVQKCTELFDETVQQQSRDKGRLLKWLVDKGLQEHVSASISAF